MNARKSSSSSPSKSPGKPSPAKRRRLENDDIDLDELEIEPPRPVNISDFQLDLPRPLNLTCTNGVGYEPLWTLWTIWSPESVHYDPTVLMLQDDYTQLLYDKLKDYNTDFVLPDELEGEVHVVDISRKPTILGIRHTYEIEMRNFYGTRYVGRWILELFGDLAEVLSTLKTGTSLIIIGGTTDYLQKTIKLNWRQSSSKCHIIHHVNDGSTGPAELYLPYGRFIETVNIEMVYYSSSSTPGTVLRMLSYFCDDLRVNADESASSEIADDNVDHLMQLGSVTSGLNIRISPGRGISAPNASVGIPNPNANRIPAISPPTLASTTRIIKTPSKAGVIEHCLRTPARCITDQGSNNISRTPIPVSLTPALDVSNVSPVGSNKTDGSVGSGRKNIVNPSKSSFSRSNERNEERTITSAERGSEIPSVRIQPDSSRSTVFPSSGISIASPAKSDRSLRSTSRNPETLRNLDGTASSNYTGTGSPAKSERSLRSTSRIPEAHQNLNAAAAVSPRNTRTPIKSGRSLRSEKRSNMDPVSSVGNSNNPVATTVRSVGSSGSRMESPGSSVEAPKSDLSPGHSVGSRSNKTSRKDNGALNINNNVSTRSPPVSSPSKSSAGISDSNRISEVGQPHREPPVHFQPISVERSPYGNNYVYSSLEEYETELNEHGIGDGEYKHIRHQCNVYGVVEEIITSNIPDSYECLIYDETLRGIHVRIHTSAQIRKIGPPISKGDIIRIHRATIQQEQTGHGRKMVISTSPHHNYTLFNHDANITGDIRRFTSALRITFKNSDRQRIMELRQLIKNPLPPIQEDEEPSEVNINPNPMAPARLGERKTKSCGIV